MTDKTPVYWPVSNWTLSGVCVLLGDLINALPQYEHTILLVRAQKPDWEIPLPFEQFASNAALNAFLADCKAGIVINNYDSSLSAAPRFEQHRYLQVIHSDDPFYYFALRLSQNRWHAVISVSAEIQARLAEWNIKSTHIPNGVNPTKQQPVKGNGPLRLLYTGRLDQRQKNVRALPKLCSQLRDRNIPFEIRIVGDGYEAPHFREQFTPSEFLGFQPRKNLPAHYLWADVYLCPSFFEGGPLTLMEALAHGCVPVVNNFPADTTTYLKSEGLGFCGNFLQGTDYIASLAELEPEPLYRLRLSIQETFKTAPFNINTTAQHYAEVFERVLQTQPLPPSSGKPLLQVLLRAHWLFTFFGPRRAYYKILKILKKWLPPLSSKS